MTKKENDKLDSLVLLRGLAVLLVCFCHFGKPLLEGFQFSGLFKIFNQYGKYGVEMFFVISGFVIPLSLDKGKYGIRDYFTFLYKRIIRLHPAYLAAIALTIIITYLSFRQRHEAFPETLNSISRSVFFFGNLGFNPVFWTLMVEAQYYIFIGFFFVILKKYTNISLCIIIPLLLIAGHLPFAPSIKLLEHIAFFFIGMVGFLIYSNHGNKAVNYLVLGCLIIYSFIFCGIPRIGIDSVPSAIVSLFTIIFILFYKGAVPKIPRFLGNISYSLYLTHFPIGTKFIRLFMKLVNPSYAWIFFILAFAIAIPVAWLFNKYIEEPSENFSRRIRYNAQYRSPKI